MFELEVIIAQFDLEFPNEVWEDDYKWALSVCHAFRAPYCPGGISVTAGTRKLAPCTVKICGL